MADMENPDPNPTTTLVIPSPIVPQPSNAVVAGPAHWVRKLRPSVIVVHSDRLKQIHFDVYFAGAKATGRWEDEWPLMTEAEFTQKLQEAADIEIGGQNPDGSHPSTQAEE